MNIKKRIRWAVVYCTITLIAVMTAFTMWLCVSYVNVVTNNVVTISDEHDASNIADWNAFKLLVESAE